MNRQKRWLFSAVVIFLGFIILNTHKGSLLNSFKRHQITKDLSNVYGNGPTDSSKSGHNHAVQELDHGSNNVNMLEFDHLNQVQDLDLNTNHKDKSKSDEHKVQDLDPNKHQKGTLNTNSHRIHELENSLVPNHIMYTWCEKSPIKFSMYLSILAAWKIFKPDAITLLSRYNIFEMEQREQYNLWLSELVKTIPSLRIEIMDKEDTAKKRCGLGGFKDILLERGGVYMSNDLLPKETFDFIRKKPFTIGLKTNSKEISFISSTKNNDCLKSLPDSLKDVCYSLVCDDKNSTMNNSLCFHMGNIFPSEIMYTNSSFGRLARTIMYNRPDVVKFESTIPGKIPKIVHMVWYNKVEMSFFMYLCLRSILAIVKPEVVYIHGDGAMYGSYFDELMATGRIVLLNREYPTHIYNQKIKIVQHVSDVIRGDVIGKYGGIYSDFDVIWVKPVDELIAIGHDAIVSLDFYPYKDFPETINLGVLMAKPEAKFVRSWFSTYKKYLANDYLFNAIKQPYKTFEKYPNTVFIEPHLQVMCFYGHCHPTFHPDFKNLYASQPFAWTTDAYSVHFPVPDPPEYANFTTLMKSNGMVADIGKFVLSLPLN